jgi:DnaJ-class molecular chaperone
MVKKQEKDNRVKVVCYSCDGKGYEFDTKFPSRKKVKVICESCYGAGYLLRTPVTDRGAA